MVIMPGASLGILDHDDCIGPTWYRRTGRNAHTGARRHLQIRNIPSGLLAYEMARVGSIGSNNGKTILGTTRKGGKVFWRDNVLR
jgi:hypothetical protein